MQIIADLHIHSKYSRAVSQKMDLFEIASSATAKGIQLVTTGDWTHPLWFRHLTENLQETDSGVYILKNGRYKNVRFLLTTEISSIYSQGGKLRRIHNLVFSPSLAVTERINKKLESEGAKLLSDGRPIIGLSSRDLLALLLAIDQNIMLVPCHAWTPWFSLYGSKSGFDSIEECFGEYANEIYAVETGLSSDPIMNWQIKELDQRAIISSSDAHSGPKLGREATVFIPTVKQLNNEKVGFNYTDITGAIKQNPNSRLKIGYTIEFFPEEGKYHWTGHRACNIRYNPLEVREKGVICPVCRRPLTVGVENRVLDLSARTITKDGLLFLQNKAGLTFVYDKEKKRKPFVSLIPLLEILTEINDGSQVKAIQQYDNLTTQHTEFDILMRVNYDEIAKIASEKLAEAIRIVRERKAYVDPGYDGVFGKVKIFNRNDQKEATTAASQESLF